VLANTKAAPDTQICMETMWITIKVVQILEICGPFAGLPGPAPGFCWWRLPGQPGGAGSRLCVGFCGTTTSANAIALAVLRRGAGGISMGY
jgi:hypothetical protein